jgi:hypothetical protein
MMTQTLLSAPGSTRRGEKLTTPAATLSPAVHNRDVKSLPLALTHPRNSLPFISNRRASALPFAQIYTRKGLVSLTDRESRATEFLIANLELESRSTHRKISPLRISNRKYSTIFHSPWRMAIFHLVLYIRASSPSQNRNSSPLALNFPRKPFASSLAPRRSDQDRRPERTQRVEEHFLRSVLIHGSAIKTCANLHCFNHMRISNRRQTEGKPITRFACLPTETWDAVPFSIFPFPISEFSAWHLRARSENMLTYSSLYSLKLYLTGRMCPLGRLSACLPSTCN